MTPTPPRPRQRSKRASHGKAKRGNGPATEGGKGATKGRATRERDERRAGTNTRHLREQEREPRDEPAARPEDSRHLTRRSRAAPAHCQENTAGRAPGAPSAAANARRDSPPRAAPLTEAHGGSTAPAGTQTKPPTNGPPSTGAHEPPASSGASRAESHPQQKTTTGMPADAAARAAPREPRDKLTSRVEGLYCCRQISSLRIWNFLGRRCTGCRCGLIMFLR